MDRMGVIFSAIVIGAAILLSALTYADLPQEFAIHWNLQGNVDGYASKQFGAIFVPVLMAAFYVLFKFIRTIDPLKQNWKMSENWYDTFASVFLLFFLYLHILTILFNLGYDFDIAKFIIPPIGLLFAGLGYLLPRTDRNWFVGIRTPWTISDDNVWKKTHELGGKLFVLAGLATIVSTGSPELAFWVLMVSVVSISLFLFIYSYWLYSNK